MSINNLKLSIRNRAKVISLFIATFLIAALLIGVLPDSVRTVQADNTAQTLPFSQNWTNTGLITTNDSWTGVAGIEGYLGQDITTATGTDPQTLLGVSAVGGDLTVLANQTNTAITNGDVGEFHTTSQAGAPGSDPTIALQGSGTADAPYVIFYLNTTGFTNINIAYNLRDIDCTTDNSAQQVALHYRVGNTGSFTNVAAGYVADASQGPSLCTLVTAMNVALPAAVNNQSLVQVRIMTTNAVGNDEWIGIDDISITGTSGGPPNLSVTDVTMNEGNAGTTNFTFNVNLSSPATSTVTFDVATADGTAQDDNPATEDNDYVPLSLVGQSIAIGQSNAQFTVLVNGDMTVEPTETFFLNVTNVVGANVTDSQGQGNITNDDIQVVQIHDIQGNGTASPLNGQVVTTTGIVTLLKTTTNNGGAANGFFLQEPDATVDADPNTSEGLLVFTSSVPTVNVGDAITITATVQEFFTMTELVTPTNIVVNSSGNPLPTAVTLNSTILDPAAAPNQPQLEKFEGMRMTAASLTSVAPNDNFFDVFVVLTAVARPLREPGIPISLTVPPDPTSGTPDCCVPRWDENPERLILDTNARAGAPLNPYTSNVVFTNVTGPLDFSFSEYRLIPDAGLTASANMSAVPVPIPLATEFTIASFNIENFSGNATQQQKAAHAIRNVMRYPDIIGVQEVSSFAVLQNLATLINNDAVAAGDPNPVYEARLQVSPGGGTQHVGYLIKLARVQINFVTQDLAAETYINPLTGNPELLHDRPPLQLNATIDPAGPNPITVIVLVNHTRSFIDIDDDPSPPGQGVRVRAKRKAQGESLAQHYQNLQAANPATSIIAVGDYNAYQFNDGYTDPIATQLGNPTPDDQVVVDASPDVVNPNFVNLTDLAPAADRYSFIFEGTPQALDHILLNRVAHVRSTRYAVARFDADFPTTPASAFASDSTRPEAVSDHDAPVAYFSLTLAPTAANGVVTGQISDVAGNPVPGTVVHLNGAQNRKTITNANGVYRFEQVETNGFYTVTPSRANFAFSPASRSFNQLSERTEAAFTGANNGDSANPLDTAEYFVRQQYVDVLNREPDEGGFNYWSNRILECGSDASCISARRRDVAAAFFIELEFQQTGSFIYGLYQGALGRRPAFTEYSTDRQQIVVGTNLENLKQALAESFVGRSDFVSKYQGHGTAEAFVDALLANVQQTSGVDLSGQRQTLIGRYQSGSSLNHSRSLVLRGVIDDSAFQQVEYNKAFVLTEYFGYLRRDPEQAGFDFWLDVLNSRDAGNFRGMVCAFITSREYQLRFSSVVSRNDLECSR